MLGFLFNFIWGLIKLYFFTLGVLTFLRAPLGWLYATCHTLGQIRAVFLGVFVDSSNWIDPIPY